MFIKIIVPIIVIVIAIGALVGFKLSTTKNNAPEASSTTTETSGPKVTSQSPLSALAGKLIVLTKDKQLASLDLATKQTTPIVTNDKIRFAKTAPVTSSPVRNVEVFSQNPLSALFLLSPSSSASKIWCLRTLSSSDLP
ncbi:hypothetical protein HY065_01205 [Candidatus Berkelbacteria bacterium]|nr:hypothetical protein [Candidatus Berkelbacteria bacterium]